MTLIKDGLTNLSARVTSDFELATRSRIQEGQAFSSEKGDTYVFSNNSVARQLTIPTLFDGPLLYMKNTSTVPIFVVVFIIAADAPGMFFLISKNPTVGTIGAATAAVPVNLNFVSAKKAGVDAFIWDNVTGTVGITGLTAPTEVAGVFFPGPAGAGFDVGSSVYIPQNGIVLLEAQNPTGGSIDVAVNMRFFFEKARFTVDA